MIVLINDTPVYFSNSDHILSTYGGTASYIAGFLKYLLKQKQSWILIGNFEGLCRTNFLIKNIKSKSNFFFIVRFWIHILLTKNRSYNDIYYCHRPDHLAVSLQAKGKHVVHLHGQTHATINSSRSWIKKRIYNAMEKYAMTKADLVIATDSITGSLYLSLYPCIQSRLIIIPTGVNLHDFQPLEKPLPNDGLIAPTFNISFIGRLAYPKQVRTIINAFSNVFGKSTSVHLWIAGSGPDEIDLKNLANKSPCSKNIHFTGQLTREKTIRLIRSSNAGILLSYNEGSPMVIKEFLACGIPVIVNRVGDIENYITDGINGFIVIPEQSGSVEQAMIEILNRSKEMSPQCRESMLAYNEDLVFKEVHEALQNLQISG